jgi:hypothetical protein
MMTGSVGAQPCRDIDSLTKAIIPFDDHLAEIDSDANLNALVFWNVGVALGEPALDAHGAFDRIDDRAELGKHAVAHQLENPPVMERDLWLEEFLASRHQTFVSALLVAFHMRGVSDDIGGENRGELAFHDESRAGGQEDSRNAR